MKVSTILDHIDSGRMMLPQFQRGYVWNRDQVRGLMDSMYRGHPVGSLLVWVTDPDAGDIRGDELASGIVNILLDGQQRITSLYGVARGAPPPFFDGNARTFTGLHFHLDTEEFAFYQPSKMRDEPLWVDVSDLLQQGLGGYFRLLNQGADSPEQQELFFERLSNIYNIKERDFHVAEVTGADKTMDVVVDIFNRVNSGGTKLSQGDLALAMICASWPEGREHMQSILERWRGRGYDFTLDWLLRNVNAIVTGEARFARLDGVGTEAIQDGLRHAEKSIDHALNLIAGRLGLDHDRVLFGRYALPVMARYIDQRGGHLADAADGDSLLHWYFLSAMWGRYSSSTESTLNQDFEAIKDLDHGIDHLLEQLRLWHGSLGVEPAHFRGWSLGARFYPVLYALTRVGEARDWGNGLVLKSWLLSRMNALEVHHIFPKALLYSHGLDRSEVNAVANYCFLTKDTNLQISARPPSEYFREIEARHPGALESQWIPMDRELWELENYPQFLEARRRLLAEAANGLLAELRHEAPALAAPIEAAHAEPIPEPVPGGVADDDEEAALHDLLDWVRRHDLPDGHYEYELADPDTGAPLAVLDLAWPDGLQPEYSDPVAVLLDEGPETLQIANDHGFRHFTNIDAFKRYAETDVLALEGAAISG